MWSNLNFIVNWKLWNDDARKKLKTKQTEKNKNVYELCDQISFSPEIEAMKALPNLKV